MDLALSGGEKGHRPEISVIVPVYRTEQYLADCLDSILCCRSIPLEVIVIDDGSPDRAADVCRRYADRDRRVRLLTNEENRGLLRTRLSGVREARGRFVAFVDSDDRVGAGFLEALYDEITRTGADIAVGRTVRVTGDRKVLYTLHEALLPQTLWDGAETRKAFYEQEGRNYAWHTIWNKLYRKNCWEASLRWFENADRRITMNEDLCLSFQIFAQSPSMCAAFASPYYYCARPEAATSVDRDGSGGLLDKLASVCAAFEEAEGFLRDVLREDPDRQALLGHFLGCRHYYGKLWKQIMGGRLLSDPQRQYARSLLEKLAGDPAGEEDAHKPGQVFLPGYCERLQVPFRGRTDYLETRIREGSETCVSFDLYDTLIMRPFARPEDLFRLMDEAYGRLTGSPAAFHALRTAAEERCRAAMYQKRGYRDVTLEEIYRRLQADYGISPAVIEAMKETEMQLELRYAMPRETGRRLLRTAVNAGRRVVLVTDMYLPRPLLYSILEKCGIGQTLPLYISAEERQLKRDGRLFRVMLGREGLRGEEVLHIGDNWQADVVGAQKAALHTLYFPFAADASSGRVADLPALRRSLFGEKAAGRRVYARALRDPGFASARALAVNRYWDDPYRDLPAAEGCGGDPFYLGYCLLGPLLLGTLRGILEEADKRGAREVVFLERDADLFLRAMKILGEYVPEIPLCRGLPLSRGILLPWMVSDKDTFAALPIAAANHSPASLAGLLRPVCGAAGEESPAAGTGERGDRHELPFVTAEESLGFLSAFRETVYDAECHGRRRKVCAGYLKDLHEDSLLFDIGYSGRIPEAVCRAAGRRIPALFLLGEPDLPYKRISDSGRVLPVTVLLPSADPTSGPLLEFFCTAGGGPFTGLTSAGEPVTGQSAECTEGNMVRLAVQKAALNYVRDWCRLYGERSADCLPACSAAALPALDFLEHFPESAEDRMLMEACGIDDSIHAAMARVPLLSLYKGEEAFPDSPPAGSRSPAERIRGYVGRSLPVRACRLLREDPAAAFEKLKRRGIHLTARLLAYRSRDQEAGI